MTWIKSKERQNLFKFLVNEIPSIKKKLEESDPRIFESIDRYEKEKGRFISNYRKIPLRCESFLVVLRKWNSYTPSLPDVGNGQQSIAQHSVGGGYFLHLQSDDQESLLSGYGLVIDPGYNFIHNFGFAGFSLDDIDGVLITHAHNDHTNDLESLLSILFQRNNRYKNIRSPKKIDLIFNIGSFKKFSNYLDLSSQSDKSYIGHVKVLSPGEVITIPDREDIECKIVSLHCKHHEIVTSSYSLGIFINIGERNILFTGDTGWSHDIVTKNDRILQNNGFLNSADMKIDVLIPHIGTIKKNEFDINNIDNFEDYFYDKHLGVLGILSSIYHYKPELCIISEFGEELTTLRQHLTDEISQIAKKVRDDCICVPGDIGLTIFLDTKCGLDYLNNKLIKWNEIKYIDVLEISGQRNIIYYSSDNALEAGDFLETSVRNGLDIYRSHYKKLILGKIEKDSLDSFALMRLVADFKFDYSDPWTLEKSQEQINDLLIALSCTLDSPIEILSLLRGECHVLSILQFLDSYYLNNQLLVDFAEVADTFGYGIPEGDKTHTVTLIAKDAVGYLRECIDHYLDDQLDEKDRLVLAHSALAKARNITIESLWPRLPPKDKSKVLLENQGLKFTQPLDNSSEMVAGFILRYSSIKSTLASMIESMKVKYFPSDERCWHAAYAIGLTEIEGATEQVEETLSSDFLADLGKAKSFQELVNSTEIEFTPICEDIHNYLKGIGRDYVAESEAYLDCMEGLIVLGTVRSEGKISSVDQQIFSDHVDRILQVRETF